MVASIFAAAQFFGTGGFPFVNPEAAALVARMSVEPNDTRKGLIDAFFTAVKAGALSGTNLLDELDVFYMLAAADSQAAHLNWKSSSYTLTPIAAPTFVVDRGYTGNGTTQYLTTDFTVGISPGSIAVQDNAHLGSWSRTDVQAATVDFGGRVITIAGRVSGVLRARVNALSENTAGTVATSIGHSLATRDNSANHSNYRNGVFLNTPAMASAAVTNSPMTVLARNNSTTGTYTTANWSTRQIACCHAGGALTANQVTDLYNAINTYLIAVGAA